MSFESLWGDLAPVGRQAGGGYFRQPFGSAEREAVAWFVEAAQARGLAVTGDGFGNLRATWQAGSGPAVLTGSHLDSVLDGGAYDGPLGVASALAAIDMLRDRGFSPSRPISVAVFVEEEGSRFPTACLGSRLATGAVDLDRAATIRDADGVSVLDAMADAGLDPSAGSDLLNEVGCFVELHVEQGRTLVHRDAAIGVAECIWPHGRWRFDFTGEANHAGATAMADRRDPMLSYAMTALAANKQARLADLSRATFGRVEVTPNGTNAIPSRVTGWLDARSASEEVLAQMVAAITAQAADRAGRDGTAVAVTPESVSAAVDFDTGLAARIAGPHGWPVIGSQAGHDAGILQQAGIATAMLFVRNPTGVSHSPAESAELVDCLAGVGALADTLALLAGDPP
ncbi:allantoate amidohydrolase [Nocardioides limicola]|uniref:allantoate amidohydrolase n=1 Tax=Nocardioides limicola TaxID=2803368 RepID=UPI00193BE2F8|nr:allantoate amidohydrolase [Nocardioides sp. DJM-14]